MANQLYDKAKEAFLNGDIDLLVDNVKTVLVNTAGTGTLYAVNIATHTFLSDIPAAARISTSANLTAKATTGGVFSAGNPTFTAVANTNPVCEAVVVYQDTGTASTSRLIAYLDDATGLPVTPNNGDITVDWDDGPNKIFKLNA